MAITASTPSPGLEELEALKPLMDLLGPNGGTAAGTGKVYMGTLSGLQGKNTAYLTPAAEARLSQQKRPKWISEEEAKAEFYSWTPKKRSDFLAQLVVAGLVPAGSGALEAEASWGKLVEATAPYGAADQQVSPYDLLSGYVKAAGGAGKDAWRNLGAFEINTVTGEKRYAGPGKYLGNGRAIQTDTRTDLTDPDTARSIATKLFQDLMGRDPQAGELSAFASALNAAEASNPITQSTVTTYDMGTGQALSSDTHSTGGLDASGKAHIGEQQIKKSKEYGVNQAVTTYQGAFESLIYGNPG